MDASNMLKPMLARGELRMVGATTLDEYRQHIEKDPALERRFQPVMVDEPTRDQAIAILRGLKEKYEVHHGVRITDTAIVAAATEGTEPLVSVVVDETLPAGSYDGAFSWDGTDREGRRVTSGLASSASRRRRARRTARH